TLSLLALLFLVSGCASMMAQFCTESAAYENGYNQAKNGENRNAAQYGVCDAAAQEKLQSSYSNGYRDGAKIAGTNALAGIATAIAGGAPRECKEAYGKKVCGYGCVSEYGQVKCASRPSDNCVAAYGQIKCGRNCSESYGKISCN
ncbi:MAG: hypothetical protein ABIR96_10370, partial [Bdellovibrionota bacterium]